MFDKILPNKNNLRHNTFFKQRKVDLVLDVGANEGQFAKMLRKNGYLNDIHSFEPVTDVFKKLENSAKKDTKWKVLNFAVGDKDEELEINISHNTVYSSIKLQTEMAKDFSWKSKTVGTEIVKCIKLDDLYSVKDKNIFLKIDTQGFEREVLIGSNELLRNVVGVQLELPVEHLYEGVWSFTEAVIFMDKIGFVPAQFHEVNAIHDDPSSGLEFDCIFRRKRG